MAANKLAYEKLTKELRKRYKGIVKELQCLKVSVCEQNGAYVYSEYKSK